MRVRETPAPNCSEKPLEMHNLNIAELTYPSVNTWESLRGSVALTVTVVLHLRSDEVPAE